MIIFDETSLETLACKNSAAEKKFSNASVIIRLLRSLEHAVCSVSSVSKHIRENFVVDNFPGT